MAATLADSNVLLDVLTEDEEWFDWSADRLTHAASTGGIVINPIIYAEARRGLRANRGSRRGLACRRITGASRCHGTRPFSPDAAFVEYRRRGGERRSPMPDFYIGAHAAIVGPDAPDARRPALPHLFPDASCRRALTPTVYFFFRSTLEEAMTRMAFVAASAAALLAATAASGANARPPRWRR